MSFEILGVTALLQVFDMPESARFYCDSLGFQIVARSEPNLDWALLRRGDTELMLNTQYEEDQRPPARDPENVRSHADTALYFGCLEPDVAYRELKEKGVDLKPPSIAPYGMKQLYLKDPDGYTICLQCPASEETRKQWKDWYGNSEKK